MNEIKSYPFLIQVDTGQARVYDLRPHLGYLGTVYVDGGGKPQIVYAAEEQYLPVQECLKLLGFWE